jgi:NTP pyrophosphatase (non-canonical NTP hydrolase)
MKKGAKAPFFYFGVALFFFVLISSMSAYELGYDCILIHVEQGDSMNDKASELLPRSYDGIAALQREFQQYQQEAFPTREANFFALELNGEAGELANLEKKVWKGQPILPENFDDEAADVLIALLNYANARGVDLASAARLKMNKIEQKRRDGTF